jgi:hypothetical protein
MAFASGTKHSMCEDLLESCLDNHAVCLASVHDQGGPLWRWYADWICIDGRSRSRRRWWARARCGRGGSGSPTGGGCVGGCGSISRDAQARARCGWRWRAAPAGGTSSRRSRPRVTRRIWPSRPIRRRPGGASGGPRPIEPTRACCAGCWRRATYPSRGSHPSPCWSGGNERGCTSRWSISARSGASGSTPSSTTMGCRSRKVRSEQPRPGRCSPIPVWACRRRRGSGSRSAIG